MTTSSSKSSSFIALVCLAFLLSCTSTDHLDCQIYSETWSGLCKVGTECRDHCVRDGAVDGSCVDFANCLCTFHCCSRPSGTWKGLCLKSEICSRQCVEQEKASSGTCGHKWFHCECLDKC